MALLQSIKSYDITFRLDVSENRPIFHSAREIYNLTKRDPDIDRLVKGASNEIMRSINKSGPRQSRLKSKSKPK